MILGGRKVILNALNAKAGSASGRRKKTERPPLSRSLSAVMMHRVGFSNHEVCH